MNNKRTKHNLDGLSTNQIELLIKEWIHSRRDRELVKLKFIEGLTYEEIAGIINLSVTQTKAIAYKSVDMILTHCLQSI